LLSNPEALRKDVECMPSESTAEVQNNIDTASSRSVEQMLSESTTDIQNSVFTASPRH
jgi:hypothetical protein